MGKSQSKLHVETFPQTIHCELLKYSEPLSALTESERNRPDVEKNSLSHIQALNVQPRVVCLRIDAEKVPLMRHLKFRTSVNKWSKSDN